MYCKNVIKKKILSFASFHLIFILFLIKLNLKKSYLLALNRFNSIYS